MKAVRLYSKIHLTRISTRYTLSIMDKQEIKKKLLEAVKNNPHLESIKSVALFGSYVNGTPSPSEDSDVDVLIDFEPTAIVGFFTLSDIKHSFESFLSHSVDLLTLEAISKYIREEVLDQAEYIYEKCRGSLDVRIL